MDEWTDRLINGMLLDEDRRMKKSHRYTLLWYPTGWKEKVRRQNASPITTQRHKHQKGQRSEKQEVPVWHQDVQFLTTPSTPRRSSEERNSYWEFSQSSTRGSGLGQTSKTEVQLQEQKSLHVPEGAQQRENAFSRMPDLAHKNVPRCPLWDILILNYYQLFIWNLYITGHLVFYSETLPGHRAPLEQQTDVCGREKHALRGPDWALGHNTQRWQSWGSQPKQTPLCWLFPPADHRESGRQWQAIFKVQLRKRKTKLPPVNGKMTLSHTTHHTHRKAGPSCPITRDKQNGRGALKGVLALGLLRTSRGVARSALDTDSCTCSFLLQVLLPHYTFRTSICSWRTHTSNKNRWRKGQCSGVTEPLTHPV